MDFETVLVTGASKGIGLQIGEVLLQRGPKAMTLVMVARQSKHYDAAVERLRAQFPEATIRQFEADLGSPEACKSLIDYVVEHGLSIDVLVNNAGYTNPVSFLDIGVDDFRHTLEVNLIAPFSLIQGFYQQGIHAKKIVNIASTAGMSARPGWLSYAASKAAMISMSVTLREELKVFGTDVICISPGRCATDLRRRLAPTEDPSTIMQPEDVARVIHFLLSKEAEFVDSSNIVVRQ